MTITIQSTAELWAAAADHLRAAPERVMFLAAATTAEVLVVQEHLLIDDADLEPGPWCVHLTDEAQQRVLQWAAKRDDWLIEIHSHIGLFGDPAQFSPLDTEGLNEWVPHVRWRLRQRPYAALVFGPETIDGVAWAGPKGAGPVSIESWDVEGSPVETTGLSLAGFEAEA